MLILCHFGVAAYLLLLHGGNFQFCPMVSVLYPRSAQCIYTPCLLSHTPQYRQDGGCTPSLVLFSGNHCQLLHVKVACASSCCVLI